MGTRRHPYARGHPYFVTFTTHEWRQVFGNPAAAKLLVDQLFALRSEFEFLLLAYVVLPDHVHIAIVPEGEARLATIVQHVKGRFARLDNVRSRRAGRLWQPRYYETVIRDEAALLRRISYIEQNPVRAGLVAVPDQHPFSSAARPTLDLERYLSPEPPAVVPG